MTRDEHEINKAINYVWLMVAFVAISCAILKGAWHQLLLAGVALVMFLAMRPKKWVHVPDCIYDDLNRQIEDFVSGISNGTRTVTVKAEEGDVCVYVSATLEAETTKSKFTDPAWGAAKTCVETNFYCSVSVLGVRITDANGRIVDSDFDVEIIQSEYESTVWE